MLEFQDIQQLIEQINNSININSFEIKHGSLELKINKQSDNKEINQKSDKTISTTVSKTTSVVQPVQTVEIEKVTPAKAETPVTTKEFLTVKSPMVGTFYASSNPDNPPFVKVGDKVQKDSVICLVEAMKMFNEIEAEMSGEIVEIHVESGQLVEYGQPLFSIRPL